MSQSVSASVLNIFRQDPFSTLSLTTMIERNPYVPNGIGALNIFEPEYLMTKDLMVEQFQGQLQIIPVSARGGPPTERVTEKRQARAFRTQRLAHGDTIEVAEIQDIIGFGNVPGSPAGVDANADRGGAAAERPRPASLATSSLPKSGCASVRCRGC